MGDGLRRSTAINGANTTWMMPLNSGHRIGLFIHWNDVLIGVGGWFVSGVKTRKLGKWETD